MTDQPDPSADPSATPPVPAPATTLPDFAPVPRLKDRSNGWKPQVQRDFIEALADTGSVTAACRRVRRATHGAYHLRRQPGAEEFAAAWDAAVDLGIRRIEDTAMDRALNGVETPVYSYGKLVGTRTRYNDRLLMFMLRTRRPERFGVGERGGGGRPGAIGQMELARLKKQWRAEYEAEQAAARPDEEEVIKSINDKLETMKDRWWNYLSPRTRAAYEEYRRLEEEDKANGYDCFEDPEHERYIPPRSAEETAAQAPWDDYFVGTPPEEPVTEAWPKIRTLRDDGWD